MGGCITIPASCNNGFKSLPSNAAGNRRSNGFEVNNMNNKKPTLIIPSTPRTRATISSGNCLLKTLTATDQPASINTHNNKDPSWEPQVAAIRNCKGSSELEFFATFITEKSLLTNEYPKHMNAIKTNTNCPCTTGLASAIHDGILRAAPIIGSVPWIEAKSSARIREKLPISGIMITSYKLMIIQD